MLIDMHAHMVPESFPENRSAKRWPWMDHFEEGRANLMFGTENFRTLHSGNWNAERRMQDMEAAGVDAEVVSPMPAAFLPYNFEREDAISLCGTVNEWMARFCEANPTRFFGLGIAPAHLEEEGPRVLEEMKMMGLLGVVIGSNIQKKSLGSPEFRGFFETADRLGLAVFSHGNSPTMSERFVGPAAANAVGYPTDEGLSIASLIGGGTADACPNLRIAFTHGGGTFMSILPRFENAWSGAWNREEPASPTSRGANVREVLPNRPSFHARRFFYDTLVFDPATIRYMIEMFGASQLLIGTDYPYFPREATVGRTLSLMGLDSELENSIKWDNAFRWLDIKVPASV
jgi:aminocarboxymuconate-semialdehyde decarboxylase